MTNKFLPINKNDIHKRGWEQLDIILITGDAYIDHPSFGTAIISRTLEANGFKVGIISQPDWKSSNDFTKLGQPKLFFGITSGNMDSMMCHYTANKKLRRDDAFSPGGTHGLRPNRAVTVYSNKIKELYKDKVPIIIGGIEASLRRFAHYDYWKDAVKKSVLFDSKANLLVYGMAETSIIEIANALKSGKNIKDLNNIKGTCYIANSFSSITTEKSITIPSFEDISTTKDDFIKTQKIIEQEQCPYQGKTLIQPCINRFLVQNPPSLPLNSKQLDTIYELPYTRKIHPVYKKNIPGFETTKFSITSHRGCFGSCSFCAITLHQGRTIQSRSRQSIIKEAELISKLPYFKGHITDIGGPTANMYKSYCKKNNESLNKIVCKQKFCIEQNKICKNIKTKHNDYLNLLYEIKKIPGINNVSISSGIRHDLILKENNTNFIAQICKDFISGKLKLAPEHVSSNVLGLMNKPGFDKFIDFIKKYNSINKNLGKKQFIEPYIILNYPGETETDFKQMIKTLKELKIAPKQIQDFTPSPMIKATCMYYTCMDMNNNKIKVSGLKERQERRKKYLLIT